jgi:predicted RNA-binding Zn-ribbon protein involved in translation (DUF1610 family)
MRKQAFVRFKKYSNACRLTLKTSFIKELAMKITHTCPKCQSSEIVKIPNGNDAVNTIQLSGGWIPKVVNVTRYMCASCGFVEEWVEAPEDIQSIKDTF